jgi:hypothetical protein
MNSPAAKSGSILPQPWGFTGFAAANGSRISDAIRKAGMTKKKTE